MSETTREAEAMFPVIAPDVEAGGAAVVADVESEAQQGGERRVADMPLEELLVVTSEAAAERVQGLYAQVVEGGSRHVADAEAAARKHMEGAQEAATSLRGELGTVAQELGQITDAKVAELTGALDRMTEGARHELAQQGDVFVAHVNGAATRAVEQIEGAKDTAASSLAEAQTAVDTAKGAAAEVEKTTRALIEVRETTVRAAVVDTLMKMAEGGDATALALIENATNSLDNGVRHAHAPLLMALVRAGIPAYLHGEAGSGKSTAAKLVARDLNIPFHDMAMGHTTGKADFFGYKDANGTIHETPLRRAAEYGGVMLFDELDSGNPTATTYVNATLANGHSVFPDGSMTHHRNTHFVAAANTIGKGADAQYVGRNRLDAATLDRFGFVQWDIDPALEEALTIGEVLTTVPPLNLQAGGVPTPKEWLRTVRAYRQASEELRLGQLVTSRAAIYGKQLIEVDLGNGAVGVGKKHLMSALIHKGNKREVIDKWDREAANVLRRR